METGRTDASKILCVRKDNKISFLEKVNPPSYFQFLQCLYETQDRGYQDLILDFSKILGAYPNGMIPLLASVDMLRRNNIGIEIVLPKELELSRLFLNANWAYFLEPEKHSEVEAVHKKHLAAKRFKNSKEQQDLVNEVMDIVMRTVQVERDFLDGLEWSINEITDNVLMHANCEDGGVVQVSTFSEKLAFAVADSGRGIFSSLIEGYPKLRNDNEAIQEAIKSGVTRNPDVGQGNGLAGSLRIATQSGGSFMVFSGHGQLFIKPNNPEPKSWKNREDSKGTFIYLELGFDPKFNIQEALGFDGEPFQPVDIIDMHYSTEDNKCTKLKIKDEARGFGNRILGEELRRKCKNLLNAEKDKPLIIDWEGVPIISSSFADELIGKLFVELGPLSFSIRIRNQGMEKIVGGLIEKAILQRLSQTKIN